MKEWFAGCASLAEGRQLCRELLMSTHPDRGGSEEDFKEVQRQFQEFLKSRPAGDFIKDVHQRAGADARAKMQYAPGFWEALANAMSLNVDVEVIGSWIHVTNSRGMDNVQLVGWGFWWSVGHKAMIWSGDDKKRVAPRYTTEELRARYGSEEKRKKRYI